MNTMKHFEQTCCTSNDLNLVTGLWNGPRYMPGEADTLCSPISSAAVGTDWKQMPWVAVVALQESSAEKQ